jgi:hypothetical protein
VPDRWLDGLGKADVEATVGGTAIQVLELVLPGRQTVKRIHSIHGVSPRFHEYTLSIWHPLMQGAQPWP